MSNHRESIRTETSISVQVIHTLLKFRTFLSLVIQHMIHKGTTFQISWIWCLPKLPFQHVNKSATLLGITHKTPNWPNANDHKSLAMSWWRSRLSAAYPLIYVNVLPAPLKMMSYSFMLKKNGSCKDANLISETKFLCQAGSSRTNFC